MNEIIKDHEKIIQRLESKDLDDFGKNQLRVHKIELSALKLQKSIEKWENDLVSATLDEQSESWRDFEISQYLADLIKDSKK